LNTPGLELVDVQGVDASHVGIFADRLTMSYNSTTAMSKGALVNLVMRAKTDGQVSNLLEMGSEITKAEAYVGNDLQIVNIDLQNAGDVNEFALYQNEPNPFNEFTVIGFDLPEAGSATLTLYDVTGKVLNVVKANYNKGYNSVRVTKDDLGVSGMIYYRLQSGEHTAVRHLVVLQ